MQKQTRTLIILSLLTFPFLLLNGCAKREEAKAPEQPTEMKEQAAPTEAMQATKLPDVISFTKAALYPEGVDYDANGGRFLVTSLHEGTVGTVSPDGTYNVLFQDDHMVSAIGIRIDSARDRVLVCNSDPGVSVHTKKETQGKLAGLAVFQLSDGKLIKYIDLASLSEGGGHFCNDIAVDESGVAYVTDSFSPIIYKVDAENNASILLKNDKFTGKGFNLNGIVLKDDYLLVNKSSDGALFKVPLNDPEKFTQVNLSEKLLGADGMLWDSDGSLVVNTHHGTNVVVKLTSSDNWTSASLTGSFDTGDVYPTTGVDVDGNIYVLYSRLNVLFNPETKQQINTFDIHKVTFSK